RAIELLTTTLVVATPRAVLRARGRAVRIHHPTTALAVEAVEVRVDVARPPLGKRQALGRVVRVHPRATVVATTPAELAGRELSVAAVDIGHPTAAVAVRIAPGRRIARPALRNGRGFTASVVRRVDDARTGQ